MSAHSDPDENDDVVEELLRLVRDAPDRRSAAHIAIRAVLQYQAQAIAEPSRADTALEGEAGCQTGPSSRWQTETSSSLAAERLPTHCRARQAEPAAGQMLDAFPRCKRLVDRFRASPGTANKTPVAVLHEYATRLSLELNYTERSGSTPVGPFNIEATLTSVGGAVLYGIGRGWGSSKRIAKQNAAAEVLETLLANVPETDFLHPTWARKINLRPGMAGGNSRANVGRTWGSEAPWLSAYKGHSIDSRAYGTGGYNYGPARRQYSLVNLPGEAFLGVTAALAGDQPPLYGAAGCSASTACHIRSGGAGESPAVPSTLHAPPFLPPVGCTPLDVLVGPASAVDHGGLSQQISAVTAALAAWPQDHQPPISGFPTRF